MGSPSDMSSDTTNAQVIVTEIADPMMGLAWECEPMLRRVEARFGDAIVIAHSMAVLVRDVADFMTPEERALPAAEGITRYDARLAQIYLAEEPIAGMPIEMGGFCLFAPDRRTSRPLCLAYEAARLCAPERSDAFLYELRHATVVACRPTTKVEEILRVVRRVGIDEQAFLGCLEDGSAAAALESHESWRERLSAWGLPAFVVSGTDRGGEAILLRGVPSYDMLVRAIAQVSRGNATERPVVSDTESVRAILGRHPLVSLVEIRAALDLPDLDAARRLAGPLVESGEARVRPGGRGLFLERL